MNPQTLDHVAYWVADRDAIAGFAIAHLGMHVVDRTDAFTLVGADARRGKLTLFAADAPRERGALEHVALRVGDLDRALAELPDRLEIERRRQGEAYFEL
ncbi:MAG TPA: VOC family protein, partial [Gaiellaceae bacterium]|nr:VOC family protein [Gaiellaceae bacterium]